MAHTLRQRIRQEGPLPSSEVYRLAMDTLRRLSAAHDGGKACGGISPDGVTLTGDGADLGEGGRSPAFMAPERLAGRSGGTAADVFGWAATVAFAASGRPPFGEGAAEDVLQRVRRGEPDIEDLPPSLHSVVMACLATEADLRPSAGELMRQLSGDVPAGDEAPSITTFLRRQDENAARTERRRKRVRITLLTLAAGLATLAVAGGGTAYVITSASSNPKPSASPKRSGDQPGTPSAKPTRKSDPAPTSPPDTTTPAPPAVRPSTQFRRVEGPNGSNLKIPVSATLKKKNKESYVWRETSTGAVFQVDATTWEVSDPIKHFEWFERKAPLPGMQRISLDGPFEYLGGEAADYEFTWTRDGKQVHAFDRGFKAAEGAYFAIYFSAPADRYDELRKSYLDKMLKSFKVSVASCCDGEPQE